MPEYKALKVDQWLDEWDAVTFEPVSPRKKPIPHFYLFKISAYDLRRLSGIYRRDPNVDPAEDFGIQRRHDPDRSAEILRYLQQGFPLSRISRKKLVDQSEGPKLQMPGWLPTAIIANILSETDERGPKSTRVPRKDVVDISDGRDGFATIRIPPHCLKSDWKPVIHPIEIIDGQHRLWALEEPEEDDAQLWSNDLREQLRSFEIPVVAFHGLDITWQAYLFYTINQLPKKVDTSLVFDLYPLLRQQDWLERFEGPEVYRLTRAQDLAILLWSHPESPWKDRIIRLGGRKAGMVTQASFIRGLIASFVKRYGSESAPGGLFGAPRGTHELALNWTREQQGAFLIMLWQEMQDAIVSSKHVWAESLRKIARDQNPDLSKTELALIPFKGPDSLLAADQGCRVFHLVMNDMFRFAQELAQFDLKAFQWERRSKHDDDDAISDALTRLRANQKKVVKYAVDITQALATFDWRSSSAVDRRDPQFDRQASYRGSGGYSILRRNCLLHIRDNASAPYGSLAESILTKLKYEIEEE